jgi:hypothetical protein
VCYLANLRALRQWYIHVRHPFFELQECGPELYEGAMEKLDMAIGERIQRFKALAEKMESSIRLTEEIVTGDRQRELVTLKKALLENWPKIEASFSAGFEEQVAVSRRDSLLEALLEKEGDYVASIQSLDEASKSAGTAWLQAIVDEIGNSVLAIISEYR